MTFEVRTVEEICPVHHHGTGSSALMLQVSIERVQAHNLICALMEEFGDDLIIEFVRLTYEKPEWTAILAKIEESA